MAQAGLTFMTFLSLLPDSHVRDMHVTQKQTDFVAQPHREGGSDFRLSERSVGDF